MGPNFWVQPFSNERRRQVVFFPIAAGPSELSRAVHRPLDSGSDDHDGGSSRSGPGGAGHVQPHRLRAAPRRPHQRRQRGAHPVRVSVQRVQEAGRRAVPSARQGAANVRDRGDPRDGGHLTPPRADQGRGVPVGQPPAADAGGHQGRAAQVLARGAEQADRGQGGRHRLRARRGRLRRRMAGAPPVPLPVRHRRRRSPQGDRAQRLRRARRVHRRLARPAPRHPARHPGPVPSGGRHGGQARVPPRVLRLRRLAREPARQGQVPGSPARDAPDPRRRFAGRRRSFGARRAFHVRGIGGI